MWSRGFPTERAAYAQTRIDDLDARALSAPLVDAASIDTSVPQLGFASDHLTELTGFGSNPGALRMFTYVPKKLAAAPALVVVLHGCTQSAASYDLGAGWSTLAERHGFVLLLPEQTAANNPKTCFNWFLPDDTARDRGEVLSIRQMIEKTIGAHNVDRERVFITGLSAGGAMTAAMLATYPEVFAAGAIIAGLPYGAAGNVQQAFESMFQGRARSGKEWGDLVRGASRHRGRWPRVSVWHGDADATVVPMNAESLVRQWTDVHGIEAAPRRDLVDGYPRRTWRRDGIDVVESRHHHRHGPRYAACDRRRGLRQGRGLSARRRNFLIAPHREILRSHRHGTRRARAPAREATFVPAPPVADDVEIIPDERVEILDGNSEPKFENADGRIDVMAVITKALTSAGLMKPPR